MIGIFKYGCEYMCIPWKDVWNERKGPEPNCFIKEIVARVEPEETDKE